MWMQGKVTEQERKAVKAETNHNKHQIYEKEIRKKGERKRKGIIRATLMDRKENKTEKKRKIKTEVNA